MTQSGVRLLRHAPGRDAKAAQDEPAKERTPATHAAVLGNVLIGVQRREIILHALRPVFHLRRDRGRIAPAIVGVVDMIGAVVPQHLAPPCQDFIRRIAPDHHPVFPHGQVLKCRIEFPIEAGFLVMQITLHRVHHGRRIGRRLGVGLRDRHGMFQTGGQRQALEKTLFGLRAGLLDGAVDFHRPAIFAKLGATGFEHLFHQRGIGQKLLHQGLLFPALLGKLGQSARRRPGQHGTLREFRIQLVTRQERLRRRQEQLGRRDLMGFRLRQCRLGGLIRLGEFRFVGFGLVQRVLPFLERLESVFLVRLPLRQVLLRRLTLGVGGCLLQRCLRRGDTLLGAADPLTLGMIHQGLRRSNFPHGLLRCARPRLRRLHRVAGLLGGGFLLLVDLWQGRGHLRLQGLELFRVFFLQRISRSGKLGLFRGWRGCRQVGNGQQQRGQQAARNDELGGFHIRVFRLVIF